MTVQGNRLPRSKPEEQGVTSSAVLAFLKEIEDKELELHSFILLRNGFVLAEGWWAPCEPEQKHMLFSLSKSFTSTAVGMAVDEGHLSVEDRVVSFFPESVPDQLSPYLSDMRVHHLLSMSTGHDKDVLKWMRENEPDNWVKGFLRSPVEYEPGTHFVYNNGASYILSAILQKVTGVAVLEYLQPRLFKPLGIEAVAWDSCPRGINLGGSGLSLTTEDIAKFGQLYLQKGIWNGSRLLSEAWVKKATSVQIPNGDRPKKDSAQGYGYQFWLSRHNAYRGAGAFSQLCIVMPEWNAVAVMTAGEDDTHSILNAVWDNLLPGMGTGSPVPEDDQAAAALENRLQSLTLPLPRFERSSPLEDMFSGSRYVFERNDVDIRAISFEFMKDEAVIRITRFDVDHKLVCGREHWVFGESSILERQSLNVAASYTWLDPLTLIVTMRYYETPFAFTLECRFDGEELQCVISQNVGSTKAWTIIGNRPQS